MRKKGSSSNRGISKQPINAGDSWTNATDNGGDVDPGDCATDQKVYYGMEKGLMKGAGRRVAQGGEAGGSFGSYAWMHSSTEEERRELWDYVHVSCPNSNRLPVNKL